jgi:hypothetical protein
MILFINILALDLKEVPERREKEKKRDLYLLNGKLDISDTTFHYTDGPPRALWYLRLHKPLQ